MTDWYKLYTITQIILIVMLLLGGFYFYNMIKDRMEIFEDPLNYVIENYQLNSCSCGLNSGGTFSFSQGKVSINKPNINSGSKNYLLNFSTGDK